MTTATAPIVPIDPRDVETNLVQYRDDEAIASGVVWDLLTHDPEHAPDLARLWGPDGSARADGGEMRDLVWSLVSDGVEFGYRLASSGLLGAFDRELATTADVARALAAVLGRGTIEDQLRPA